MRKYNFLSSSLAVSMLLFFTLSACKKEETGSKELLVFLQGEYGPSNNTVTATLTQTPTAVWGNTKFTIPIHATREVPSDVMVQVKPDERYLSQFNTVNGKKAVFLPSNTYSFNAPAHTVKAGTFVTEAFQITITAPQLLTDTNGYVLPVSISGIESQDKGVKISNNRAVVYLYVPYKYSNVDSTQVPLTGTQLARTGWSVSVSNTTTGALGPAMLDGNNTTAWRSSNSSTAAKWVVLNLGSRQLIKGFKIVPNYVAVAENATKMTLQSSNDNITWTNHGEWNGTGPSATSSAASPDVKGVNFISPVQAQYFRFEINSWVSGSRVGIGEIYAL